MAAINSVEELKLRIVDHEVVLFDNVHAGCTIGRADGTFGFAFVSFSDDFETFNNELQEEIRAVQNSNGLRLNNDDIKKRPHPAFYPSMDFFYRTVASYGF